MSQSVAKVFNTVGPCVPEDHYMLSVLSRQPEIDGMIEGKYYFVLHAPRQSGKTTYLKALTKKINSEEKYYALNCSLMTLRDILDDDKSTERVVSQINQAMGDSEVELIRQKADTYNLLPAMKDPNRRVRAILNSLCKDLERELVVFFDEADCLSGPGLLTFLGQIRDAYQVRHDSGNNFPRSMALVGMRDIRDYQANEDGAEPKGPPPSPFNIKKDALTLPNFTQGEIGILYRQHTEACGQVFKDRAIERAWHWSEGQPWLVNALAYEAVVSILKNNFSLPVTAEIIDEAAENLIKRRDVHIDSLLERLKEPKVARVMNAVLSGMSLKASKYTDDRRYCLDLGLVSLDENNKLRPANAIYQEVLSRVLIDPVQSILEDSVKQIKWNDGKIIFMSSILKQFQQFWRENAFIFPLRINESAIEELKAKIDNLDNNDLAIEILDLLSRKYDEAVYYVILLAYLQRIVNGGALVHRQFAEGRGAVDLSVSFKDRKYLIECKIKGHKSQENSLDQLAGYLDSAGEKEGWLVFFDRDREKGWTKKITWETATHKGLTIHIVGC